MGSNQMSSDPDPQLLVVVVDTNFKFWERRRELVISGKCGRRFEDLITFTEMLEALFLFINSFAMSSRSNRVAVIASHIDGGRFLYPDPSVDTERPLTQKAKEKLKEPQN